MFEIRYEPSTSFPWRVYRANESGRDRLEEVCMTLWGARRAIRKIKRRMKKADRMNEKINRS